jgi:predicted amidohydrolase
MAISPPPQLSPSFATEPVATDDNHGQQFFLLNSLLTQATDVYAHRQAATWIGIAAGEQARVVLLPEMALTGYFTSSVLALAGEAGSAKVANARLRAAEDVVAAACREHGIYAIVGVPVFFADVNATSTRCEGPCDRPWFNTALVIDPSGKKQYRQAKLYPCCKQVSTTESAFFSSVVAPGLNDAVVLCVRSRALHSALSA